MRPALHLDPRLRTPLYQQLVEQLSEAILSGQVEAGEALPSVRELALEQRINPNTVARAYRELEQGGLLTTHPGKGVFVRTGLAVELRDGDLAEIHRLLDQLLRAATRQGLSLEQVVRELQLRARQQEHLAEKEP